MVGVPNPKFKDSIDKIQHLKHGKITNLEMETAGIYGLGELLGHDCLSVNAILANRVTGHFSSKPQNTVDQMIRLAIEHFCD